MSFEYTIQINNIKKSYDLKKANAVDKVFKKYFFSKDEHKKNIEKAMQNIFLIYLWSWKGPMVWVWLLF